MDAQVQRCQKALSLDSNAVWANDAHKLLAASQAALQQAGASSDSSAGHAFHQQQQRQSKQQQSQHQPASEEHDGGSAAAESNTENVAGSATYGQYSYVYGSDGRESSNPSPEPGMPSHGEEQVGDESNGGGLLMKAFTWVLGKHWIPCCRECKQASNSPETVSISIQQDASAYSQHE